MNFDRPPSSREEAEVRITALLLGELSPTEAAASRAQIADDTELTELQARLAQAVELVREASTLPEESAQMPERLSRERREMLLNYFQNSEAMSLPGKPRREWFWAVPLSLAAGLIALLGGALWFNVFFMESGAQRKSASDMARFQMFEAKTSQQAAERQEDLRSAPLQTPATDFSQSLRNAPAQVYLPSLPKPDARMTPAPANLSIAQSALPSGAKIRAGKSRSGAASASPKESRKISDAERQQPVATNDFFREADITPSFDDERRGKLDIQGANTFSGGTAVSGGPLAFDDQTPATMFADSLESGHAPQSAPSDESEMLADASKDKTSSSLQNGQIPMLGDIPVTGHLFGNATADALRSPSEATQDGNGVTTERFENSGKIASLKNEAGELLTSQVQADINSAAQGSRDKAKMGLGVAGEKESQISDDLDVSVVSQYVSPGLVKKNDVTFRPSSEEVAKALRSLNVDDPSIATLAEAEQKKEQLALPQLSGQASSSLVGLVPAPQLEAAAQGKDDADEPLSRTPAPPALVPQAEVATSANAYSTFSLNVSDVAFKLAGASLEQDQMPEAGSMRSEEFINAFDYHDPEPAPGAPLAFASERARYPFAQNRDLLRFSVKTAAAGRQPGRPLNLVLLLDNSGSMERADRVHIVTEALRVLAAQLQPQDKLSVVTFARTPRLWVDGVAGDHAAEAIERVSEITPQGGTNLEAALDLGYATALRHYQVGSINRVVLLTDGAANLGVVHPEELRQKVETHRLQGVALDCFGIGWEGLNDDLLEQLSRHGDGRYGFINTPDEAASNFAGQLAGALRVAASDVKVQVEFNPRRVTSYRQIGYAKHQLTKEQFRDNTVDAAELGAAESGNALYAVEVNPRGAGDLATVRVRFKVPGTPDYREQEWTVPFTPNVPRLAEASSALRLAGAASAFSEWLGASPYAAEVTPNRLLGLLNGVPASYGADPRPQKLEWMIRTAKSLSGK